MNVRARRVVGSFACAVALLAWATPAEASRAGHRPHRGTLNHAPIRRQLTVDPARCAGGVCRATPPQPAPSRGRRS